MKRTLCLALFGLLCCSLSVSYAVEAPATPAAAPTFLSPRCAAAVMTPAHPEAAAPVVLPADLLAPQPRPTTSCSVNVLCRCGQVLRCTSAAGDCQRIPGCSVTCDGNEQVCPPCNGFGCF